MSSSKGILIDGLTSGGSNTVASLRLMLTKPDVKTWQPDYNKTIIDLVKSAAIKTYWLSNQVLTGEVDTPVTSIANRSDSKYFLKYGGFSSKNTSDFLLLDKIEDIVKHDDNKKLIVVHLYGSHPHPCDRIFDHKTITDVTDKKYAYINCYISSIHKVDLFLQKLNSMMNTKYNKSKRSYSILYFADHGLTHNEHNGVIYLTHSKARKLHYGVPLFKVSSDDDSRLVCTSFKSGLHFVDGLAAWMGTKNKKLKDNYSLFDCKNDPDDYGLINQIEGKNAEPDPAIDIRGK